MCKTACREESVRAGDTKPDSRSYANLCLFDGRVFIGGCVFTANHVDSALPDMTPQECVPTNRHALLLQNAGDVHCTWLSYTEYDARDKQINDEAKDEL